MLVVNLAPLWICFLLCFVLAWMAGRRNWISPDWRLYWVFAALANGFLQVLIAEAAGAFHSLDRATVRAAWIEADLALAGLMAWTFRADFARLDFGKSIINEINAFRSQTVIARLMWALGVLFALFLGCLALQAPTTVADCQDLHAARIIHWQENKSLQSYASKTVLQVCDPPGGEIASCTLCLLAGSDRPLNLPSWFALLTCALLASLVTEMLMSLRAEPAGMRCSEARLDFGAAICFVLVLTIPGAVAQAISAETDLAGAMWALCFAALVALFVRQPANMFYAAGAGVSLSVGICAKGVTFLSAAPFLAGAFVLLIGRRSFRAAASLACVVAVFVFIVNVPWLARNIRVFGHPFGPARVVAQLRTGDLSPGQCAANIVRHLSVYTSTPSVRVTQALNDLAYTLVSSTGRPLEDSASIYYRYPFHLSPAAQVDAGWGWGNIHAWLMLLALIGLVAGFRLGNSLGYYAGAVCLGFCLTCSCVRWQPECYRFHLPCFVMAIPVVALFLATLAPRAINAIVGLLCLANAMLVLLHNPAYPVSAQARLQDKPREEQMFSLRPSLYGAYAELAEDIVGRGCTNVLLKAGANLDDINYEYALWVCLKNRGFHGVIEDFQVTNETARLSRAPTAAQTAQVFINTPASITAGPDARPRLTITYGAELVAAYPSARPGAWIRLLRPDNAASGVYNLAGYAVGKAAKIRLLCKPIDRNGAPITNNILRVAAGGIWGDVDLRSNQVNVIAPVTQSAVPVRISLLQPVSPQQSPASLTDLQVSFLQ